MSGPRRRIFIPAIRDMIVKACPLPAETTLASIDRWTDGEEANTPVEAAVFSMCDQVAADIDEKADAQPDLDDLEEGDS